MLNTSDLTVRRPLETVQRLVVVVEVMQVLPQEVYIQ